MSLGLKGMYTAISEFKLVEKVTIDDSSDKENMLTINIESLKQKLEKCIDFEGTHANSLPKFIYELGDLRESVNDEIIGHSQKLEKTDTDKAFVLLATMLKYTYSDIILGATNIAIQKESK